MAPQSAPAMQLSPTLRGTALALCLFLISQGGVGELPLTQVDYFSGCIYHGLDPFADLTPPTFQLDCGCSVQCSDAGLCLCFHQLLDEDSMVIFQTFISLTIGQGQFGHPLLYCLGSQLGSSLWIPGNFSRARFLASPIVAPSNKISLSTLITVFPPSLKFSLLPFSLPLPFYPHKNILFSMISLLCVNSLPNHQSIHNRRHLSRKSQQNICLHLHL